MKGKNWRKYEAPPKKRKPNKKSGAAYKHRQKHHKKRRLFPRLVLMVLLFFIGYCGFILYFYFGKPYIVAIDPGHGGEDIGAEGIIKEVDLAENTADALEELLKEDGRFRIVRSRKNGETKSIDERNHRFVKARPDIVLSIHGNSSDNGNGYGFECYPSVPGMKNHEKSLAFASCLTEKMEQAGAKLRGDNGIRFGYYGNDGNKILLESSDNTTYDYDTFGILKNMNGAAVLVEQCFLTNKDDVERFATPEGCKRAAKAYYEAILCYLDKETEKTD